MIIWRPSANKNRFAYSLVNDLDQDDEEDEGMENKNFGENLKILDPEFFTLVTFLSLLRKLGKVVKIINDKMFILKLFH